MRIVKRLLLGWCTYFKGEWILTVGMWLAAWAWGLDLLCHTVNWLSWVLLAMYVPLPMVLGRLSVRANERLAAAIKNGDEVDARCRKLYNERLAAAIKNGDEVDARCRKLYNELREAGQHGLADEMAGAMARIDPKRWGNEPKEVTYLPPQRPSA